MAVIMRPLLMSLFKYTLTGAAIGAVAGAIISGLDLHALIDGAFIGAVIGAFLACARRSFAARQPKPA